jgi:hypothetical protein
MTSRRSTRTLTRSRGPAIVCAAIVALAIEAGSCQSSQPDEGPAGETGDLAIELYLPSDVTLVSIGYRLSGNGITPIREEISINGAPTSTSALFARLPAGADYALDVSATCTDATITCRTSARAQVWPGKTTNLFIPLHCQGPANGAAVVTVNVVSCPEIRFLSAAPLTTSVGGSVDLAAQAVTPDGATPIYAWTATSGTLSDGAAPVSRFTCAAPGPDTITLTVTNGPCAVHTSIGVTCVSVATQRIPTDATPQPGPKQTRSRIVTWRPV